MDERSLKLKEAQNHLALAEEYAAGARESHASARYRIAADTAYNACELCAKALLLLELDEIPFSHGGVVGEFSRLFVKTEQLPKEVGRSMHKALDLRNKARYVYNADISASDSQEVIELAGKLLALVSEKLESLPPAQ